MAESVLDTLGGVIPLLLGPAIAWTGWDVWRRPDAVPGLLAGGPPWVVRCWSIGFVLLGVTVCALGAFNLADRKSVV